MGLREWINGIISKRFGRKKLNAANIDTAITEGEPTFHSTMDELKVSGIDDLSKFSFEEIQQEYISSLSEMAGKYKNAILNDETLKKIREEEMKTGKIGETPFICTF